MKLLILFSLLLSVPFSFASALPEKSDVNAILPYVTPARFQGERNLCTVFSFTALLETLILQANKNLPTKEFKAMAKQLNYSEQWVQYVFSLASKGAGAQGALLTDIFKQVKIFGVANEEDLPYNTKLWTSAGPEEAIARCGDVETAHQNRTRCFSSHYSPLLITHTNEQLMELGFDEIARARDSARENQMDIATMKQTTVSFEGAKQLLSQGIPVVLKLRFFYGSWNHAAGNKLGIDTSPELFAKGIVTMPVNGSVDQKASIAAHNDKKGNAAIHSVLLVGYDDTVQVKYKKLMTDGTVKEFTNFGVFYFKNSWDSKKFGKNFKIGKKKLPGFGMMLQDHVKVDGARPEFYTITL